MPSARPTPSAATRSRVARAAGDLGAAAVQQMEADHEWYRSLSAEDRSWVGLVAQAGITSFLDWFGSDQTQLAVTADVYAPAAEARGAWDARLESLVVDAVLRGEADESMQSRAAALGWGAVTQVVVVVGSTPPGATAPVLSDLHRAARPSG